MDIQTAKNILPIPKTRNPFVNNNLLFCAEVNRPTGRRNDDRRERPRRRNGEFNRDNNRGPRRERKDRPEGGNR